MSASVQLGRKKPPIRILILTHCVSEGTNVIAKTLAAPIGGRIDFIGPRAVNESL